jgi:predicted ATPase with chaperone activity
MLKLEENNRLPDLDRFCMSGELALSGQLRSIKGVLSIALEASIRACKTAMSDYIATNRSGAVRAAVRRKTARETRRRR